MSCARDPKVDAQMDVQIRILHKGAQTRLKLDEFYRKQHLEHKCRIPKIGGPGLISVKRGLRLSQTATWGRTTLSETANDFLLDDLPRGTHY
jgi:hypothetical protein